MRLAQRIMNGEKIDYVEGPTEGDDIFRSMVEAMRLRRLRDVLVFMVDNVASYVNEIPKEKRVELPPCLAPPFKEMWVEYHIQGHRSGVHIGFDNGAAVGLLYLSSYNGAMLVGRIGFMMKVEKDGSVGNDGFSMCAPPEHADQCYNYLLPVILGIGFMHCKNVTVREERIPEKLRRAREKRAGRPGLIKWNVLDIEPMKQVLRTEGQSDSVGLKQALHICRGHFKDYRQSGLFGKVKGIFWWDSTVRGSSKQGVVVKDYNVKAPA